LGKLFSDKTFGVETHSASSEPLLTGEIVSYYAFSGYSKKFLAGVVDQGGSILNFANLAPRLSR